MTNLINQITINGKTTTFLNYVNPVVKGEPVANTDARWSTFFQTQLGSINYATSTDSYWLRFKPTFETLTAQVTSSSAYRCALLYGISKIRVNTTNGTGLNVSDSDGNIQYNVSSLYTFAVINDYACVMAHFKSGALTTLAGTTYFGWAKDGQYQGSQYPRNFIMLTNVSSGGVIRAQRITQEGTTAKTELLGQNPTISCITPTAGADSTDVIIRDSTAPNNYIGKLWNMMVLPSSAVVGKIYKNTGTDPDTGVIETDQKAFWMCVGSWGTDKIGMRIWTEGIV